MVGRSHGLALANAPRVLSDDAIRAREDRVYPATCTFHPEHAECELANGEMVDEAYLQAHTTVIRNVDVLHGRMTCGVVCVDDQGSVLGHVSTAMQAWRERNCLWVEYGMANC